MRSLIAALVFFVPTIGVAETVQLSKMDSETRTYIQRGNIYPNVVCYSELLESFWQRGLKEHDVWVSFDDPSIDGIGIGFDGSDEYYTCEKGELRIWEMGNYQVLKRHD